MATLPDPSPAPSSPYRLPVFMWISGVPAICGAVAFASRIVWEETVWTWRSGAQMVGFSLAHGSGAVLFFFPLLLLAWVIVLAGMIVRSLIKRRNIWKHVWVMLGLALAVFAVLSLPYSFWQRVFVGRLASGPYGAELMDYAAASGEIGLVKAFISHGVSVNAVDREGKTGTHAAAAGGSVAVLKYLMSQGANLNALDRYGDSPLEIAAASGQNEAVKFLQAQGAKRIRGDDAQREKASRDIVREDIEKMH